MLNRKCFAQNLCRIEDEDIFKIVKQNLPLDKTAETLVDTANSNGGKDNISVILIKP